MSETEPLKCIMVIPWPCALAGVALLLTRPTPTRARPGHLLLGPHLSLEVRLKLGWRHTRCVAIHAHADVKIHIDRTVSSCWYGG